MSIATFIFAIISAGVGGALLWDGNLTWQKIVGFIALISAGAFMGLWLSNGGAN